MSRTERNGHKEHLQSNSFRSSQHLKRQTDAHHYRSISLPLSFSLSVSLCLSLSFCFLCLCFSLCLSVSLPVSVFVRLCLVWFSLEFRTLLSQLIWPFRLSIFCSIGSRHFFLSSLFPSVRQSLLSPPSTTSTLVSIDHLSLGVCYQTDIRRQPDTDRQPRRDT